jgi:hypothetical protein
VTRETAAFNAERAGDDAAGRPVPVAEQGRMGGPGSRYGGSRTSEQERTYLRRHIAVNIVGENPAPLTSEARDMVRRTLAIAQQHEADDFPAA